MFYATNQADEFRSFATKKERDDFCEAEYQAQFDSINYSPFYECTAKKVPQRIKLAMRDDRYPVDSFSE